MCCGLYQALPRLCGKQRGKNPPSLVSVSRAYSLQSIFPCYPRLLNNLGVDSLFATGCPPPHSSCPLTLSAILCNSTSPHRSIHSTLCRRRSHVGAICFGRPSPTQPHSETLCSSHSRLRGHTWRHVKGERPSHRGTSCSDRSFKWMWLIEEPLRSRLSPFPGLCIFPGFYLSFWPG